MRTRIAERIHDSLAQSGYFPESGSANTPTGAGSVNDQQQETAGDGKNASDQGQVHEAVSRKDRGQDAGGRDTQQPAGVVICTAPPQQTLPVSTTIASTTTTTSTKAKPTASMQTMAAGYSITTTIGGGNNSSNNNSGTSVCNVGYVAAPEQLEQLNLHRLHLDDKQKSSGSGEDAWGGGGGGQQRHHLIPGSQVEDEYPEGNVYGADSSKLAKYESEGTLSLLPAAATSGADNVNRPRSHSTPPRGNSGGGGVVATGALPSSLPSITTGSSGAQELRIIDAPPKEGDSSSSSGDDDSDDSDYESKRSQPNLERHPWSDHQRATSPEAGPPSSTQIPGVVIADTPHKHLNTSTAPPSSGALGVAKRARSRSQSAGVGVSRSMALAAAHAASHGSGIMFMDSDTDKFVGRLKDDPISLAATKKASLYRQTPNSELMSLRSTTGNAGNVHRSISASSVQLGSYAKSHHQTLFGTGSGPGNTSSSSSSSQPNSKSTVGFVKSSSTDALPSSGDSDNGHQRRTQLCMAPLAFPELNPDEVLSPKFADSQLDLPDAKRGGFVVVDKAHPTGVDTRGEGSDGGVHSQHQPTAANPAGGGRPFEQKRHHRSLSSSDDGYRRHGGSPRNYQESKQLPYNDDDDDDDEGDGWCTTDFPSPATTGATADDNGYDDEAQSSLSVLHIPNSRDRPASAPPTGHDCADGDELDQEDGDLVLVSIPTSPSASLTTNVEPPTTSSSKLTSSSSSVKRMKRRKHKKKHSRNNTTLFARFTGKSTSTSSSSSSSVSASASASGDKRRR
ncbi:hypothetical protein EV182_000031 [Spiromyces aspiralis]|uniref:Uncharacterized protein n=1 Tax=Spiromyces aspiralis TaxID=68401 RepID=A0ACC1HJS7_9FUNG|nr:hypothetical protein EV182_000031 [Spiromyces aspiralis]